MKKFVKGVTDTIEVCNRKIFGDNDEHDILMDFHDGYAISKDGLFGMTYPMYAYLTKDMKESIELFTDRECDSPFDIALKYGVLFELPHNVDCDKKHDFLMNLLTDDQLQEYEQFANVMDKREYFMLFLDTMSDCGIEIRALGLHDSAESAVEHCKLYHWDCSDMNLWLSKDEIEFRDAASEIDIYENRTGLDIERIYHPNGYNHQGEFYYLLSRGASHVDENECVMVWNRNGLSKVSGNILRFFSDQLEAHDFATARRVEELKTELDTFGINWGMEPIKFTNSTLDMKDRYSFNIWGNDGYNVHIIHGKLRQEDN